MEPYHKELHEILTKKGYTHIQLYDKYSHRNCDIYEKNQRTVIFWEDDSIVMREYNGSKVTQEIFDRETDGIFNPGD